MKTRNKIFVWTVSLLVASLTFMQTGLAQPANDLCANAVVLCGGAGTVTGTTIGATTTQPSSYCGTSSGAPEVWYELIGTGSTVTVDLCTGTSFDTKLKVWSGSCGALTCVAGNDDYCGLQSSVTFSTTAGVSYYVTVFGWGSSTGPFTLTYSNSGTCPVTCVTSYPYFENFEAGAGGWTASGLTNWALGTTTGGTINTPAPGGSNSWETNLYGDYNYGPASYLNSPCFDFSGLANPYISFDIWWDTETNWDGCTLQSSTDGGTTWSDVGAFGDPNNWYDNSYVYTMGTAAWSAYNGSGGWVQARHDLTSLANQSNVMFRFYFDADYFTADGIGIDNINVSDPALDGCSYNIDIQGLDTLYCWNGPVDTLFAFPGGGSWTGPGLTGGGLGATNSFTYTGAPDPIPDGNPTAGLSTTQTISGAGGNILGTSVILDSVNFDITHTWIGDLDVWLISPDNDTVMLANRPGPGTYGCSDNDINVNIVRGMGNPLSGISCGTSPLTGSFTAEVGYDLDSLNNNLTNPNGTWELYVTDNVGGDAGVLNDWTLYFTAVNPGLFDPSAATYNDWNTLQYKVTSFSGCTDSLQFDEFVSQIDYTAGLGDSICYGDSTVLGTNARGKAYGIRPGGGSDFIRHSLYTPGTITSLSNNAAFGGSDFPQGGDFDDQGNYYFWGYYSNQLKMVDTATATVTIIGTASPSPSGGFTGLAWDPTTNTMYTCATSCGSSSTLYTVDLTTGALTTVGPLSSQQCAIWIAINSVGQMYMMDIVSDNISSVDKTTGATTLIGSCGFSANYGQDADFDASSDTLWLAAFNYTTFRAELRWADLTTGNTTLLAPFAGSGTVQISSWGVATLVPPGTFAWTPTTGLDDPTSPNPKAGPLTTTTYSVTVTDSIGCQLIDSVTVWVNQEIVLDMPDEVLCYGETVQIGGAPTATGGIGVLKYSWAPATGLDATNTANPMANPTLTTTYTLTVTDSLGCFSIDSLTVTVVPNPVADGGIISGICSGTNITLGGAPTASGGTPGYTYSWTPTTGLNDPTLANPVATPTNTTTYTVLVTDVNGCTAIDSMKVIVYPIPDATITAAAGYCINGGPVTLTAATAGGTWSGTGITDAVNGVFDPAVAGIGVHNITYTVTSIFGCVGTDNVNIEVFALTPVSITSGNSFCINGGIATLTASVSGGSWSGNGITNATSGTFDPTVAGLGTHMIVYAITDGNGCDNADTIMVTVNPAPDASITPAGPFCDNDAASNLTAATSGGFWSGTGITNATAGTFDPSVAGAGVHTITYIVTDGNNCTDLATTNIEVFASPVVSVSTAGPFCANDAPVAMSATPTGGTWSGPGITNPTTGMFDPAFAGPGVYTITYTVTNGNGCTGSNNVQVTVNEVPDPTITPAGPFCANDAAINLSAASTGGTWSGTGITNSSAGTFDPVTAGSGVHTITYSVTNNSGCTDQDQIDITVYTPVVINGTVVDVSCSGGANGEINLSVSGGTNPYTYNWSNGETAAHITGLTTGNYDVTVTDVNGCSEVSSFTVNGNPPITETHVITPPTAPSWQNGAIDLTPGGGVPPYEFIWSNGATTEDISGIGPDTFRVTIIDAAGCRATFWIIVDATFGLGIDLETLNANIGMYPNPSNGMVHIEMNIGMSTDMNWSIYDAIGRKVFERADRVNGSWSYDLDMGDMASGQYMVRFNIGDYVISRKLIISK